MQRSHKREIQPATLSGTKASADLLTVIAISSLAYVVAVGMHEFGGHALACVLLGIRLKGLGAFYISYDGSHVPELSRRIVAIAGAAMGTITGMASWIVLRYLPLRRSHALYFFWLFGTFTLLISTGALISGISGIGDFGATADGALYRIHPEWLWRTVIAVLGFLAYSRVARLSVRRLDGFLGGGAERIKHAKFLALTSYFTGGIVSLLIGMLNPRGIVIVLVSAAASSLGGTSALVWMTKWINPSQHSPAPKELELRQHWGWISVSLLVTAAYAIVFGPTLHP